MLSSYLKSTLRNTRRQWLYSVLNIIGLTLGIVSAVFITTFVRYELSYESFLPDASHTYRVIQKQPKNMHMGSNQFVVTPAGLAKKIQADVPNVVSATTFGGTSSLLSSDNNETILGSGLKADENFLQVFRHPVIHGNPNHMLQKPDQIVLTSELAKRLFGQDNPVGKIVNDKNRWGRNQPYVVSGVINDVPSNSHLQFEYLISLTSDKSFIKSLEMWDSSSWYTYFRIPKESNIETITKQITDLPAQLYPNRTVGERREFIVEPITAIHLESHANMDIHRTGKGDIRFVYLLATIGILILLLACSNYINLAIASSVTRGREVGVRLTCGATRRQIATQFLIHSVFMAVLAGGFSLAIVEQGMAPFAQFVGRNLSTLSEEFFANAIAFTGIVLAVGLIGGIYPAIFAARMRPSSILKSQSGTVGTKTRLRKVLVTFQFVVSVALIASSLVIYRQMQFIQHQDTGYRKDHIVTVELMDESLRKQFEDIRQTLLTHPGVLTVASSNNDVANIPNSSLIKDWAGHTPGEEVRVYTMGIGYDFLDTYELPIVKGRGFSRDITGDVERRAVIINETALKQFGWQDSDGKYFVRRRQNYPVVGVVRDFNMHALKLNIMPLMMHLKPDYSVRLSIKMDAQNIPETLTYIQNTLQHMSAYPIHIRFVDDVLDQLYQKDQTLGHAVGLFTFLAIIIGALGLFGLVAYTAETRTKEIGVRKVLGASVPSILKLFVQDYIGLIIIAGLLGTPIAYFAMNAWLHQFAYRIALGPFDFLLPIVALTLIAACSMSYQAIKAAHTNPVDALRNE